MNPQLFAFYDGHEERGIDPLVVLHRLDDCPGYYPHMIDVAIDGDPSAIMVLSEFVRRVFQIEFVDSAGHGMTRLQCVQLIDRFDRWLVQKRLSS